MTKVFSLDEARKLAGEAIYDRNFEPYELEVRIMLRAACEELAKERQTVSKLRDRLLSTMHMKVTDKGVEFQCLCVDCETTRSVLELPHANR